MTTDTEMRVFLHVGDIKYETNPGLQPPGLVRHAATLDELFQAHCRAAGGGLLFHSLAAKRREAWRATKGGRRQTSIQTGKEVESRRSRHGGPADIL